MRQLGAGALQWNRVISGTGIELALTLGPRFGAILYHGGVEVPGFDLGAQLVRNDRRLREYIAPRVFEHKGAAKWQRRVTRAVDEILAVWNPTTLYIAVPPPVPMPELPAQVVVVPTHGSMDDALVVWEAERVDHGSRP
jgi:hypothetical protein